MDEQEQQLRNWVHGFQDGDECSARHLVDALHPLVVKIVRARLPRQESEEDLVQEIFMKVFQKIDQYRGGQPFSHWVSRISLTTCLDRLRHHRRRPLVRWGDLSEEEQQVFEQVHLADPRPPALDLLSARDLVDRLLSQLNPTENLVIRMLDLESSSVEEISHQTGWSASKVKVTAFRARAKMRQLLQKLEPTHA